MKPRPSPEAFFADPHDGYVSGDHYVAWCHGNEVLGSIVWGTVPADELRFLLSLWQLDARMRQNFEAVSDVLALEGLALEGFGEVAGAYDRAGELRHLRRHALVCAPHVADTMRQVFFPRFRVRYEEAVFATATDAFAWLKHPAANAIRDEVTQLVTRARQGDVRTELAAYCRAHLQDATIAGAAEALARPMRTLQRELEVLGTSFREELSATRIAVAHELLTTTTRALRDIATEVGCASPSHLSSLYRKLRGVRPSDARKKI